MSVRRPTMRSSASLLAGLLIAATVSSGATAATQRAGSATTAFGAGAPAAASPAVKKFDPHFVPRTVGRRAPNNVRRLAARKPTVRPVRSLPVLGRTTGAAPAPSGSGPKAALAAAPAPVDATTNSGDPAALTGFDGMSRIEPRHQRRRAARSVGRGRARARRPDGQPDDEHHRSPGRGSAVGGAGRLLPAADRHPDLQRRLRT